MNMSTISDKNSFFKENIEFDDDEEFVVIPDCFDLTKKWKSQKNKDRDSDISLKNDETLLNISTEEQENTSEVQVLSPTLSSQEIMPNLKNEKYAEDTEDSSDSEPVSKKELQDLHINEKESSEQQSINNKQLDDEKRSPATAFDLMKAAFSNLNGPSLVSHFFL